METPVHIDFQGMEPKEKLHAAIARHVAELEKRFGRITGCRVVLNVQGNTTRPAVCSRFICGSHCRTKRK